MGRPGCGCCVECATTYKIDKETGRIEWARNLGVDTLAIAYSDDKIYVSIDKGVGFNSTLVPEKKVSIELSSMFNKNNFVAFRISDSNFLQVGDAFTINFQDNEDFIDNESYSFTVAEIIDGENIVTHTVYSEEMQERFNQELPYEFFINKLMGAISKYDIVVLDVNGKVVLDECVRVLPDNANRFTKLYAYNDTIYALLDGRIYEIIDKKIQSVSPIGSDFYFNEGKFYLRNPVPDSFDYIKRIENGFEYVQKTEVNQLNSEYQEPFDVDTKSFSSISGIFNNLTVYDFDDYKFMPLSTYSGEHYKYTVEETETGAKIIFEEFIDSIYPAGGSFNFATTKLTSYDHRLYYQSIDNAAIYHEIDENIPTNSGIITFNGTTKPGPLYRAIKGGEAENFVGYGFKVVDIEKKTSEYDYMSIPQQDIEFETFNTFMNSKIINISGTIPSTLSPTKEVDIVAGGDIQKKIDFDITDLQLVESNIAINANDLYEKYMTAIKNLDLNPTARLVGCDFIPETVKQNIVDGKIIEEGNIAAIFGVYANNLYSNNDGSLTEEIAQVTLTPDCVYSKLYGNQDPVNILLIDVDNTRYKLYKYKTVNSFVIYYIKAKVTYDIELKEYTLDIEDEKQSFLRTIEPGAYWNYNNGDTILPSNNALSPQDRYLDSLYDYYSWYLANISSSNTQLKFSDFINHNGYKYPTDDYLYAYFLIDIYLNSLFNNTYVDTLLGGYSAIQDVNAHLGLESYISDKPEYSYSRLYYGRNKKINNGFYPKLDVEDLVDARIKYVQGNENGDYPINSRSELFYPDDKDYIVTDSYDGDRKVYSSSLAFYTVSSPNVAPVESTLYGLYYPYKGKNTVKVFETLIPCSRYQAYTKSGDVETLYPSGIMMKVNIEETTGDKIVEEILKALEHDGDKPDIKVLSNGPLVSGEITLLIDNTGKEITLTDEEFLFDKKLILKREDVSIPSNTTIEEKNPINHIFFSGAYSYQDKFIGFTESGNFNIETLLGTDFTTGLRSVHQTDLTDNNILYESGVNVDDVGLVSYQDLWKYQFFPFPGMVGHSKLRYSEGDFEVDTLASSVGRLIKSYEDVGYDIELPEPIPPYTVSGNIYGPLYSASESMDTIGLEKFENKDNCYLSQPNYEINGQPAYSYTGKKSRDGVVYFDTGPNGVNTYSYYVTGKAYGKEYEPKEPFIKSGVFPGGFNSFANASDPTIDSSLIPKDGWTPVFFGGLTAYTKIITPEGREQTFIRPVYLLPQAPVIYNGNYSGEIIRTIGIHPDDNNEFHFEIRESGNIPFYAEGYADVILFALYSVGAGGDIIGVPFSDSSRCPIVNGQIMWNGTPIFDTSTSPPYRPFTKQVVGCDFVDGDDVLEDYGVESGVTVVYCSKDDGEVICYKNKYHYEKLKEGINDINPIMLTNFTVIRKNSIDNFVVGPKLDGIGWDEGNYAPYPLGDGGRLQVTATIPDPLSSSENPPLIEHTFNFPYSNATIGPIPNTDIGPCYVVGIKDKKLISKELTRSRGEDPSFKDVDMDFVTLQTSPHPVNFWAFGRSGEYQDLLTPSDFILRFAEIPLEKSGEVYESEKFNIFSFDENGLVWKNNYLMNPRKYNSFMEYTMDKNDYNHDKLIKDITSSEDKLYMTGEKRKKIISPTRNSGDISSQERLLADRYCGEDNQSELNKILDTTYNYSLVKKEDES